MDLICPVCGEPWDFDSLHEEAAMRQAATPRIDYDVIFSQVSKHFRLYGCTALREVRGTDEECSPVGGTRTAMARAAYDVCGDDLDGAASLLEDLEW